MNLQNIISDIFICILQLTDKDIVNLLYVNHEFYTKVRRFAFSRLCQKRCADPMLNSNNYVEYINAIYGTNISSDDDYTDNMNVLLHKINTDESLLVWVIRNNFAVMNCNIIVENYIIEKHCLYEYSGDNIYVMVTRDDLLDNPHYFNCPMAVESASAVLVYNPDIICNLANPRIASRLCEIVLDSFNNLDQTLHAPIAYCAGIEHGINESFVYDPSYINLLTIGTYDFDLIPTANIVQVAAIGVKCVLTSGRFAYSYNHYTQIHHCVIALRVIARGNMQKCMVSDKGLMFTLVGIYLLASDGDMEILKLYKRYNVQYERNIRQLYERYEDEYSTNYIYENIKSCYNVI